MDLQKFLNECNKNECIDLSHVNGIIVIKFKSCWTRFPDTRTDKMIDFLNFVNNYK